MKKLYRNKRSGVGSGIFGGLGEWMEVNPNILRIGFIVLIIITGIIPGIILYLFVHFLVPKKRLEHQ